jgi:cytochrome c peroxidase
MHNASLATLEDVIEFYNQGGGANKNLDPAIEPLKLSKEEVSALVAFLKAL